MKTSAQIVEQLWTLVEQNTLDRLEEIVDPDVHMAMPGIDLRGVPALRQLLAAYVAAIPDLKHRTLRSVEQGEALAVELQITGHHTGPFATPHGALPPTGNPIELYSCDIVRLRGGKIISWRAYYDPTPLLTALGALPPR